MLLSFNDHPGNIAADEVTFWNRLQLPIIIIIIDKKTERNLEFKNIVLCEIIHSILKGKKWKRNCVLEKYLRKAALEIHSSTLDSFLWVAVWQFLCNFLWGEMLYGPFFCKKAYKITVIYMYCITVLYSIGIKYLFKK